MSQLTINLTAGQQVRQQIAGRFFMIESIAGADALAVTIEVRGQGDRNDEEFFAVGAGFKAKLGTRFDAVRFRAAVDCTVVYVISDNEVDFDFFAGAQVNATIVNPLPVPVSNDRGTPGNLLHVTGVSINDAPAVAIDDSAPVACSDVAAVVVAADPDRRTLRIHNIGPDDVAIGGPGITWANRCIVLKIGDVWVEERAANLAWSAITDAGGAASVTAQEITA